jgi:hypothetical protein
LPDALSLIQPTRCAEEIVSAGCVGVYPVHGGDRIIVGRISVSASAGKIRRIMQLCHDYGIKILYLLETKQENERITLTQNLAPKI